jgi:hypothetical protein
MNVGYDELYYALGKAIKLLSIYAEELNSFDGGARLIYKDEREWLATLRKLDNKELKND